MSTHDTRPITRTAVIDAASRVIARHGDHNVRWSVIASEAGNEQAVLAASWFEYGAALVDGPGGLCADSVFVGGQQADRRERLDQRQDLAAGEDAKPGQFHREVSGPDLGTASTTLDLTFQ